MGNEPAPYRRFRVANGLPIEGLYDSVVDVRLQRLLDAARKAGIDVGVRELKGRDGRLLARELANALLEAIETSSPKGDAESTRPSCRERTGPRMRR